MEDIVFLMFCLLSINNIKINGLNRFFNDYISLENTYSVKGIFVWLIIFSHNNGYYKSRYNYMYKRIIKYTGQKMVSLFLFYSGYGIYESIKAKGINYVKTLPSKGIVLYIKFQLILLIFLFNNLFLGIKINLKQYFLSIILKSNIGNSYWFVYTIICLYFYSYISFRIINYINFNFIGIIFINILSYMHFYLTFKYFYKNRIYAVDNILCFQIGLYFSLIKKFSDKIIMKNDIIYFGNLIIIVITYYNCLKKQNIYFISITNSLFSLIIILITMKIRFNNEFLNFLNTHSYSIYLLQRIPMIFIYNRKYFSKNEILRFFIIFIIILFLSSLFDKYTNFIDKYFKNIKNKNNYTNIKVLYINK